MNTKIFNFQYWRHYLALEADFLKTIRFVEIDESNFNTFSIEFNKQLQSICSEIDVICKEICSFKGASNTRNINQYAEIILKEYTDINSRNVIIKQYTSLKLSPFEEWSLDPDYNSPEWWKDYNSVKHDRTNNFSKANLKNVINSLAGLYLLEMFFLKDLSNVDGGVDIPNVPSMLFAIENWETKYSDSTTLLIETIG